MSKLKPTDDLTIYCPYCIEMANARRNEDGELVKIPEGTHTQMYKSDILISGFEVYVCEFCGRVQLMKNPSDFHRKYYRYSVDYSEKR